MRIKLEQREVTEAIEPVERLGSHPMRAFFSRRGWHHGPDVYDDCVAPVPQARVPVLVRATGNGEFQMSTHPSSSDPQRAVSGRTVFITVIVRLAVWPSIGPD